MSERRDKVVGFRVEADVADFIDKHGKARQTDLTAGRFNFSVEVNDYLRGLMSKIKPEAIGHSLARRKEELRLQMEAVDKQAQQLLGVSTIEEWIAREREKDRIEADVLSEQKGIRDGVRLEILDEVQGAWKVRHQNGRSFEKRSDVAWVRHRFQDELRTLGWTAEEFVKRMERENRSPEVG